MQVHNYFFFNLIAGMLYSFLAFRLKINHCLQLLLLLLLLLTASSRPKRLHVFKETSMM